MSVVPLKTDYKPLLLSSLLLLSGCSSAPESTQTDNSRSEPSSETAEFEPLQPEASQRADTAVDDVNDPLEGFNRVMWDLNYDILDPYFARPVSIAYMEWTPYPLRKGLSNFLANLDEPSTIINNALMGNGTKAVNHFNRFWINSTIGLLGLIDIASEAGIDKDSDKEFGDVLGHYGVGNGPYLMLPGYGPWTPRQIGDYADDFYMPLSWLTWWQSISKWALQGLETRYQLIPQEPMLNHSPDPYALARSVFLQRQAFKAEITPEVELEVDQDLMDEYLSDYQ